MAIAAMVHKTDPRSDLLKRIGNLDEFTLFGNQILAAVYERPEKTKSGIYLADTTRQEDSHQGKSALIVKTGPAAFKDDPGSYSFHGLSAEVGDWIAIFVSDGRKIIVNGVLCRIVEDQHVRLRLPSPDCVY